MHEISLAFSSNNWSDVNPRNTFAGKSLILLPYKTLFARKIMHRSRNRKIKCNGMSSVQDFGSFVFGLRRERESSTYSVVNDLRPANASCATRDILLFDKSMRRNRLKFANAFGVISVMKFCSKRLHSMAPGRERKDKGGSGPLMKCTYTEPEKGENCLQNVFAYIQFIVCDHMVILPRRRQQETSSWQQGNTHNSVVSSGNSDGTLIKLFSRQSTIPSAQRHGCGQLLVPPHSIGAFSVRPMAK